MASAIAPTLALDLTVGSVYEAALTADASLASPPGGGQAGRVTLIVRQDAGGGCSLARPPAVSWAGGTAPVVTPAPGAVEVYAILRATAEPHGTT